MRIAVKHYDDGQPYAYLGRCYDHDKEYEQLPIAPCCGILGRMGQVVHFGKGHQQQVHGIQHQLHAHENDDGIAPRQHADDAENEQGDGKEYVIVYGHIWFLMEAIVYSLLPITTAPTMALRNRMELISKGTTYSLKSTLPRFWIRPRCRVPGSVLSRA